MRPGHNRSSPLTPQGGSVNEAVGDGEGGRRRCPSRSRKKKSPKRVLGIPDLEHAKTAVLNILTSVGGQRTYDYTIREFVVSLSTALLCSATGFALNSGDTRRRRSTLGSPPSRTRRPTLAS
jgi:hypothetical protein